MQKEVETLPTLEPKQLAAAEYLIQGKPQREAYKLAGYKPKTNKIADTAASQLFSNVKVAKYIQRRRNEIVLRAEYSTGVSVERTMRELARTAFVDPAELFDENGRLRHVKDMPVHVRTAIASVEVETLYEYEDKVKKPIGTLTKLKFWNKVDSLDKLCKIQGMYVPEKFDLTVRQVQVKEISDLPKDELLKLAEMQTVGERQN